MQITKIEIFGYGKWIDKTVHLDPQLNVISGRNGSGKSTLMSFVLSILFGFPNSRRKKQRKYDVNEESHFGGRLHLTDTKYGNVIIERTKKNGKQLLYMMREDDTDKIAVSDFSDLVNGLSKQDYLSYFGFSEEDLMSFVWENEEDFAKSLVSLGVSGRRVLNEITPHLQNEADQIYKPNGQRPILNQQLGELDDKAGEIIVAKKDEDSYFDLTTQWNEDSERLKELRQQQSEIKALEVQLELANQQEQALEEYQLLDNELKASSDYGIVSKDINQLDQVNARLAELATDREHLLQGQADLKQVKDEKSKLASTAGMEWMQAHQEDVETMYAEAKAYRNHLNNNEDISEDLIKKRYERDRLLKLMGVETEEELPEDLSDSERKEWQRRYRNVQNKQLLIDSEGEKKAANEKALADLDAEEEELRAEFNTLKEEGTPGRSLVFMFGVVLAGIGLLLFILSLIMDSTFFTASGIAAIVLGIIFIIFGLYSTQVQKRSYREDIKAYELDFIDIEQEREQLHTAQHEQETEKISVCTNMNELLDELEQLAVQKGGQDYIEILSWIDQDYVSQIKQLSQEIRQSEIILKTNSFIGDQQANWQDYQTQFPNKAKSEPSLYKQFETDYLAWRESLAQKNYADFETEETNNQLNHLNETIINLKAKKQAILDQYQVDDRDTLLAKYSDQMDRQEKENRYQILANHLDLSLLPFLNKDVSLQSQLADTQNEVKHLDEQIHELQERTANQQSELRRISASGQVNHLIQEKDSLFNQAYEAATEWAARKIAINVFEEATVGETGDANHLVMSHAVRYLSDLTDGKYDKLRFDKTNISVHNASLGWLPVGQLSRGEKALLFIAMRFAFLSAQLGQIQLPIIIDEAFAHLDDKHKHNVYRFLSERGLDNQIILLTTDTFDTEMFDHLSWQRI